MSFKSIEGTIGELGPKASGGVGFAQISMFLPGASTLDYVSLETSQGEQTIGNLVMPVTLGRKLQSGRKLKLHFEEIIGGKGNFLVAVEDENGSQIARDEYKTYWQFLRKGTMPMAILGWMMLILGIPLIFLFGLGFLVMFVGAIALFVRAKKAPSVNKRLGQLDQYTKAHMSA